VTKLLSIDGSLNDTRLGDALELEDDGFRPPVGRSGRIGIDYASEEDRARLWRFFAQ